MIWVLLALAWLWEAAPSIHWLDTAELTLASASLGIGHPPGQWPHTLVTALFQWIPVGDVAFRATLCSLAMSCVTAGLVWRWARRHFDLEESAAKQGIMLIVIFGLCRATALQAVRSEVYAMTGALAWGAITLAGEKDVRMKILGGLAWGLALYMHPVIALFALPFLILELNGVGFAMVMFSSLGALFLPLRASSGAAWNFGNPVTAERWLWFVRGKLYKAYDQPTIHQSFAHGQQVFDLFSQMLTPLGVILVFLGIYFLVRKKHRFALPMVFALGLGIAPLVSMGNFWPNNPDALGYLVPAVWLCFVLSVVTISQWNRRGRIVTLGMYAVLAAWAIWEGREFVTSVSLRSDWSARRQMLELSREPEVGATVDVASFSTLSFLRYAQAVEGIRPDLSIRYRGLESIQSESDATGFGKQWWQLALKRDVSGRYTLREEDLLRAGQLTPVGWFCNLDRAEPGHWIDSFKKRVESVRNEIPAYLDYPREPLVLSFLVQILLARKQGRIADEKQLTEASKTLFPDFQDYDLLQEHP